LSDNNKVGGLVTELSANVMDAAENPATEFVHSFTVDKTAPVISSIDLAWGTHLNITEVDASQNVTVTMSMPM
jgi:hypothetical protein